MATQSDTESFGAFFRRYTKTWMHAIATAGLTAFGTLTIFHRGFVVLALACYLVPPVVLYFSRRRTGSAGESESLTETALAEQDDSDRGAPESGSPESAPAERESESAVEREPAPEPSAGPDREPESAVESGSEPATPVDSVAGASTESDAATAAGSGTDPDPDPEPEAEPETDDSEPRWRLADAPIDATLLDVTVAGSSAVVVGEGGIAFEREHEHENGVWRELLADGPAAQGQPLRGVDATDDGEIVWVAGDGGAVGRLEVASGRHTDYSAPADRTDNLTGLAVAGASDDETILLINGSGEVLRGRYRDGEVTWSDPVQPGSGSSLSGVALVDPEVGYCCDTNDGVFETDDGGRSFETVGLEGADGTLTGIVAATRDDCHASTDAGVVHRFDGSTWTPERVGETALTGIAGDDGRLVVCDADGAVYDRSGPTADWERADVGASEGLEGVALGEDLAVAVGGDGTVLEWR